MSQPFHILKHEHRIIERVLRSLDGVCARLEGGTRVPASALLEIADFVTTFADQYHHGKEEQHLFPALERSGIPREGGPLSVMEYEHQLERELIAGLRQSIDQYADGDAHATRSFVEAGRAFLSLLVSHIEKEDSILFRIGDEVLDETEKVMLAKDFKQLDAALGGLTLQDYERKASELEQKWAL
jgi:hemerythrin-like domain-containing protein